MVSVAVSSLLQNKQSLQVIHQEKSITGKLGMGFTDLVSPKAHQPEPQHVLQLMQGSLGFPQNILFLQMDK